MNSGKRGNMAVSKTQEQLLEDRRNLLIQLYCISQITELKNAENHDRISKEIERFLEEHDYNKGRSIDVKHLPKFKPREPPVDKKLARSKSSSPAEVKRELKKRSKDTTPTGMEEQGQLQSLPQQRALTQLNGTKQQQTAMQGQSHAQQPILQEHHQHKTSSPENQNSLPSDKTSDETTTAIEISKARHNSKHELDIEEEGSEEGCSNKKRRLDDPSNVEKVERSEESIDLPTNPYAQLIDISELHADPTPIEIKKREPYVIHSIESNLTQKQNETFFPNDSNVKEAVYMITSENAPTKLAKAMPIQEIKYVSQTLPLLKLIPQSQKALTTDLINTALNEGRITVVASRIEELRRLNLWSLRQPKKFIDPITDKEPITHSNLLIEEAKWMREDFRESLNYKIAMCAYLAQEVMDFWSYGKVCCINRKQIIHLEKSDEKVESSQDIEVMINATEESKELIEGNEDPKETVSEQKQQTEEFVEPTIDVKSLLKVMDPSEEIKLPSLPKVTQEVYMMKKAASPFRPYVNTKELTTLGSAITNVLPIYLGLDEANLNNTKTLPFEPVSKAIAPLDEDHFMKLVERQFIEDEPSLVSLSKRRGMFYGNRRSHYLRPPVAPSLRYLKFRTPTIWLPEDDQELVKNINQYAYNWDLISSQMSNNNIRTYVSNIERRTPWQCFERFVQLNEKFNVGDMKGPKAHNAQVWLYEAHKLQQQQKRRISPLGVGSESIQRGHRRLRWASMFEAMRKCIKKRENAPRPNPSQPRKPLDVKNMTVPTPQEMAELKSQRDEALRRDIQLKRAAKQRIQMAQYQQQQQQLGKLPLAAASSPNLPVTNSSNGKDVKTKSKQSTPQSAPVLGEKLKVTTQTPPQRNLKPVIEREIIEGYARKILLQKPDFTPELALKAAESYYRNVTLRQQQVKATEIINQTMGSRVDTKNASPTPQEILQRAQKK